MPEKRKVRISPVQPGIYFVILVVGMAALFRLSVIPKDQPPEQLTPFPTGTHGFEVMMRATEHAFSTQLPENIVFSPDRRSIIGMEGMMIGLWDADTLEFIKILKPAYSPPGNSFVEFSTDGRYMWNAGMYFYLWDIRYRQLLMVWPYTIANLRSRHSVSEDGRYFAFWQCDSSGSSHGICSELSFLVYDAASGEEIVETDDEFFLFVSDVEFDEEAGFIKATGCKHFQVLSGMAYGDCEEQGEMIWDLQTGILLQ